MAMAAPAQIPSLMSTVISRVSAATLFTIPRTAPPYFRRFSLPFLPSINPAMPPSILFGLPPISSFLEDIWDGILRAVPKKKTSHSKKRHRQLAGKALKDVTALCQCPACGAQKRMHHLCPECFSGGKFSEEIPSGPQLMHKMQAKAKAANPKRMEESAAGSKQSFVEK